MLIRESKPCGEGVLDGDAILRGEAVSGVYIICVAGDDCAKESSGCRVA